MKIFTEEITIKKYKRRHNRSLIRRFKRYFKILINNWPFGKRKSSYYFKRLKNMPDKFKPDIWQKGNSPYKEFKMREGDK